MSGQEARSAAKPHTTTSYSEAKANELGVNVTRAEHPAARDHYESCWFGWCELCSKWRLRIFWWVGADGLCGDTVCGRCRPGVKT